MRRWICGENRASNLSLGEEKDRLLCESRDIIPALPDEVWEGLRTSRERIHVWTHHGDLPAFVRKIRAYILSELSSSDDDDGRNLGARIRSGGGYRRQKLFHLRAEVDAVEYHPTKSSRGSSSGAEKLGNKAGVAALETKISAAPARGGSEANPGAEHETFVDPGFLDGRVVVHDVELPT